ncbi:MAG: hypothetical protein GY927_16090, partial [bacterium]|nr:hypothetical protein [bacterium]
MAKSVTIDFNARVAKFEAGIDKATNRLNRFSRNAKRQSRSMSNTFSSLGAKIAGVFGGLAVGRAFLTTTRDIEKLKASLVSVTGSTESAKNAFALIEKFASTTPYSIQELTSAFVKLTALGLEPSKEALTSFGNTASAMGKTLDQFVEAVADAATGEFERLKEFGIKASSQGEKVAFTFQGITKTVGKNAKEIEGYLRDIGDVQFAGAMERQANTLDGAFSNAGDAIDRLITKLGEGGLNAAIKTTVKAFAEGTNAVTEFIESTKAIQDKTDLDGLNADLAAAKEKLYELIKAENEATGAFGALQKWSFYYQRNIKSTTQEIAALQARIDEVKGPDVTPTGTEALKAAGDAAKTLGKETKKLFDTKAGNPLDGMASDAAKISKTFNLIGNALTIDGKGG